VDQQVRQKRSPRLVIPSARSCRRGMLARTRPQIGAQLASFLSAAHYHCGHTQWRSADPPPAPRQALAALIVLKLRVIRASQLAMRC